MMNNLFSSFDPSSSMMFSHNWLIMLFLFTMIPLHYFFSKYPILFLFLAFIKYINNEFGKIMNKSLVSGSMMLIFSFLIFIILSNFIGLFPFIFTSTSHMMITFMLAMSIWWAFLIFRIFFFSNNFFTHLLPNGTPSALMMFMVLIETISLMIRPITLSIRLSANMIAGHLLLTLLGSSFFLFNMNYYIIFYISQIFLMVLEIAVAIIQGYVFTMLMVLYSMEI